jgi:hypothetical protein
MPAEGFDRSKAHLAPDGGLKLLSGRPERPRPKAERFGNLMCGASVGLAAASAAAATPVGRYQHVLLISIDGMHAVDLQNFIARHPTARWRTCRRTPFATPTP